MQKIPVNDEYYLSPCTENDIPQIAHCCNDLEIYNNTLRVPYPYTADDARTFLNFTKEMQLKYGRDVIFAIRNSKDELVGSVGFVGKYDKGSHKEEIGYWVATEIRRQGVATDAVKAICKFMFEEMNYLRVEALVFLHNAASQKVLSKAGFMYEGLLRKFFVKGDRALDVRLYALVR